MNRALLCLAVAFLIAPTSALAAGTPEDTVTAIVAKLKENGDPAVVLEYVSWDDALKDTPPQVLQSLGVSDAAGLKDQTGKLMAEPAKFVREKMSQRIATLPPEQQAVMNKQLEPLTQKVEQEFKDMKGKLKRTEFKVGKSEIAGDTATVDITATIDGTTQENKLKLVKRGDNWLLASPEFGKRRPPAAGPGAPGAGAPATGAPGIPPAGGLQQVPQPPAAAPAPH